jgi:outer membrane protein assembly factor BamB
LVRKSSSRMGSFNHREPHLIGAARGWSPRVKLGIKKIDNPDAKKTLGDTELALNIKGPGEFPMTVLIQPLDFKGLVGIDPYSLRVFRKNEKSDSLQLVWNSGVNISMGFVWAKIRHPGIYVVLGLPRDKLLREILRELANFHRYSDAFTKDEIKDEAKKILQVFTESSPEELDEWRRILTVAEIETTGADAISKNDIRLGEGGTVLPFPLPKDMTVKELNQRLPDIAIRPEGLPEEILFYTDQPFEEWWEPPRPYPPIPIPLPPRPFPWPYPRAIPLPFPFPFPIPNICWFRSPDWWMYHHDERHSGLASGCSRIRSTTVGGLRLSRSLTLDGPIISVPSIVQGKIYVGTGNSNRAISSRGGTLYKIDLVTGAIEAEFTFNTPSGGGSRQGYSGVGSSPAVVSGRVYFSGLDGRIYCLDTTTLTPIWITDLRNPDPAHNQPVQNYAGFSHGAEGWSSPLVVNNRVYTGFGEGESSPASFGFVYCLDANTGNVIWLYCTNQFSAGVDNLPNVIPPSAIRGPLPSPFIAAPADPPQIGASPWSHCAYERTLNRIYIGIGNSTPDDPLPDPKYASALLSLDATTGQLRGFFQPSPSDSYRPTDLDVDVPAGPTIFTRGGSSVVAIGSKNGSFFLLDPNNLNNVLARRQLLPYDSAGNPFPNVDRNGSPHENYSGIFGTAAVHYGLQRLFVGIGGYTSDSIDSTTTPFMRTLDWNTLGDAWATSGTNPPKYTASVPPMYTTPGESGMSSPAVVNDVVFMSTSKIGLYAFDASTGTCLWSPGSLGGPGYARGPAIYRNHVVIGTHTSWSSGTLYIYSL